jgi:hypothetical protein
MAEPSRWWSLGVAIAAVFLIAVIFLAIVAGLGLHLVIHDLFSGPRMDN